jgi:hypothetical protein
VRYDRASPPTDYGILHVELFNAGAGPAIDIKVRGSTAIGGTVEERMVDALPSNARLPWAFVVRPANPGDDVFTVDNFTLEGDCTDRNESAALSDSLRVPDGACRT